MQQKISKDHQMDLEMTDRTNSTKSVDSTRSPLQSDRYGIDLREGESITDHDYGTTNKISANHDRSNNNADHNHDLVTWKNILQRNRQLYDLANWTGIIYPIESPEFTEKELKKRQRWVIFMHYALLSMVIAFLIVAPFSLITPYLDKSTYQSQSKSSEMKNESFLIISWFCGYLPLMSMFGDMITLRKSIVTSIPLFHPTTVMSDSKSSQTHHTLLQMDCQVIVE